MLYVHLSPSSLPFPSPFPPKPPKPMGVCVDKKKKKKGTGDNFYKQGQLLPENFEKAASETGIQGIKVRYQPDYDHSYYTMATFADDHVDHAAQFLFP